MAKGYLSQKGVSFIEKNIRTDPEARAQLITKGYTTVPLTVIGEHHILGFKPTAFDEALKKSGLA